MTDTPASDQTAADPTLDPLEQGRTWPDDDDQVRPGPPEDPWTGFLGGVDTSKWQGQPVDGAKVHGSGVRYWYTRATNGAVADELVAQYAALAHANNIPFGVYTFFRPAQDAAEQARLLVEAVQRHGCTLVPQLDIEHTDDLPPETVGPAVRRFARAVQDGLGASPVLYSNGNFWNVSVKVDDLGDLPLWAARYPTKQTPPADPGAWAGFAQALQRPPSLPTGWDRFDLWQFSAQGNAAAATYGFPAGDLDLNICRPDSWERLQLVAGASTGTSDPRASSPVATGGFPLFLVRRNDRPEDTTVYAFDGVRARALVDENDRNVLTLMGARRGADGEPVPVASNIIDAALGKA
jgi:GH25 family lysozyme M1 (1,4-beta-N-acetylmuramidase)